VCQRAPRRRGPCQFAPNPL